MTTLREKLEEQLKLFGSSIDGTIGVEDRDIINLTTKILTLISKEIKKNRPKVEQSEHNTYPNFCAKCDGMLFMLERYDSIIDEILK